MFALYEQSPRLIELSGHIKQTNASLIEQVGTHTTSFHLSPQQKLILDNEYLLVEEGLLQCELDGIPLVYFCEGDLLSPLFALDTSSFYKSLTDIKGKLLSSEELISLLNERGELFTTLLEHQSLTNEIYLELLRKESIWLSSDAIPGIEVFQTGDPIIIQETSGNEIYTMLYGAASVYVKDKKVGQILQNEIFGALSLADEKVRNASVIADRQCVVASIPEDKFVSLLTTHPETVTRLIRSMARVITSQNERLAE